MILRSSGKEWASSETLTACSSDDRIDGFSWKCLVKKDSLPFEERNGNTIVLSESGSYEVYFTVSDSYGFQSASEHAFIYIDSEPPEELTVIQDKKRFMLSASDSLSGVDESSFCYKTASSGWICRKDFTLPDCLEKEVYVRVSDKAGNVSCKTFTVTVDTEPPVLSFTPVPCIKKDELLLE